MIADLERKRLGTELPRVAFVEQAVSRLSEKATPDQIARTREAAGAAWQAQTVDTVVRNIDQQAAAAERLAAVSDQGADAVRQVTLENKAYAQAVAIAGEGDQNFLAIKQQLLQALTREDEELGDQALSQELRSRHDALDVAELELSLIYEGVDKRAEEVALLREKQRLTEQFPTATEAEIDNLVKISAETAKVNATIKQKEEDEKQWQQVFKQGIDNVLTELEDALFATKSWDDAFKAIANTIQHLIIDALIKQPLEKGLSAFFGSLMGGGTPGGAGADWGNQAGTWLNALLGGAGATAAGSVGTAADFGAMAAATGATVGGFGAFQTYAFHEGGGAGVTGGSGRQAPAALFAHAPRYHWGGSAGLAPDEIPAILQRGERVLSRRQTAAFEMAGASRRAAAAPTVVMNITTPDAASFRASASQISAGAARMIRRAGRDL